MKKAAIVIIGVIVVIGAALFVAPPLIGGNMLKPHIADAVRDATGREIEVGGDVGISLLPNLTLDLTDVRLANPDGMSAEDMVSIGNVSASIRAFPAIMGRDIHVDKLVITEPSIFLEVNESGKQNWAFESGESDAPAGEGDAGSGDLPISNLHLGDVRIVNGVFSFIDATSGQRLEASGITLAATLADIADKLTLDGELTLNEQIVKLNVDLSSPKSLLDGSPTALLAQLDSALIKTGYDGGLQTAPVPGLDGTFRLDIGSVGALMAWLEQPLDATQPDPGPLNVMASFKAEGSTAILESATIKGEALEASATGSLDATGAITKVALNVESGTLDIDRYLPPPAEGGTAAEAPSGDAKKFSLGDLLGQISDEPFDLSPLQQTEADVNIVLNGIKAAGYEIGKIAFTSKLAEGKLAANLSELALYGGNITGQVSLDGAGDTLGLETAIDISKVAVGKLAAAATGGKAPVTGIASGDLKIAASGANPRALVQDLKGALHFDLGGVDIKDAPEAVSEIKVALELPGLESPPSLKGSLVYRKGKVEFDVGLDPLDKVLSGDRFAVKAGVTSKLAQGGYEGFVQQDPVPGLDGTFDVNIASVGKLASWLGQPLAKGQKDPGPLKVKAVFKADGEMVALETASIDGKDLKAEASGSYDGTGEKAKVVLNVKSGVLNIDRYLPPAGPAKPAASGGGGGNPLAGLSEEPIDYSALRNTDADINLDVGGVKVAGFEVGPVKLTSKLAGGKLAANLADLGLYGGKVTGAVTLDGAGDALAVGTDLALNSVDLGKLSAAAAGGEAAVSGIANGTMKLATRGISPRSLAQGVSGKLDFALGGVDVGEAPISDIQASIDIPGLESRSKVAGSVVYNKEKVTLNLDLDPPQQIMSGKPFALTAALSSNLMKLAYQGRVQSQPAPGLDGTLNIDVGSVGKLLAWMDVPLGADQPDPGPFKFDVTLAADEKKMAIKSASIGGKAIQATARGSVDARGDVIRFDGNVDVQKLDLNAYIPPTSQQRESAQQSGAAPSQGWSTEPLPFGLLRTLSGNFTVKTGPITYGKLDILSTSTTMKIDGGILNATIENVQLAQGSANARATVDGSGKTGKLNYQVQVTDVESKPFLITFADLDWLSGKLNYQTKGASAGSNQKQIVSNLNGDGAFTFLDGAIEGFDLAGTLRSAQNFGTSATGETPKTDFSELSGTYVIAKGIMTNNDLKMLAPLVRVTGAGTVPLPPQTVDYKATAKLVASLEGQGGSDALAGIPIPVRVYGPWSNIKHEIDWAGVFAAAAADPERLLNMPDDLSAAAKGYGINLPIPGLGGGEEGGTGDAAGELLKGLLGGGTDDAATPEGETAPATDPAADAAGSLLKGLLGGGDSGGTATQPAQDSTTQQAPAQEQPAEPEQPKLPDPGSLLKKLF